ncbi:hypothetical protein [Spirosoma aerophilum]
MKTSLLNSVVTRSLIGLMALSATVQLTGCQPTDIKPSPTQPTSVHIVQPSPKPTIICLDGCPDGVVRNLPYQVPQPVENN